MGLATHGGGHTLLKHSCLTEGARPHHSGLCSTSLTAAASAITSAAAAAPAGDAQIDVAAPETEAKQAIIRDIRDFIHTRIIVAGRELTRCAVQKVCLCV